MEPTQRPGDFTSEIGEGFGDGHDLGDPADLWVFDAELGEYRLRLPSDPPPASPATTPAALAPGEDTAEDPSAPRSASRAQAGSRVAERRTRRKAQARRKSLRMGGSWGVIALGLIVVAGGVSYAALRHGTTTAVPGSRALAPGAVKCSAVHPSATSSAQGLPAGSKARPIDVRVAVFDGSGKFGQAQAVLTWMQNTEGFLRTSNNGPTSLTPYTSVVYAPNHVDQARTLAAAMRLPDSALHGTGKGTGPRDPMVLTLGEDFMGAGLPLATPSATASATGCATAGSG